ncbi:MAG: hypothetical protein ACUVWX_10015 [Kiritimatiellia bacterium]
MKSSWFSTFKSPGSEFRGKPFWAWNAKLEPEELRRQIRIMHKMGLGGFFMHSRVGLATPYLGKEWFEAVSACVDEARKLSMEAWLYDEDRWPSGAAGGLVTRDPRYRMRQLRVREYPGGTGYKLSPNCLACFAAKIEGATARNVRLLEKTGGKLKLDPEETLVVFEVETQPCSDWYNGYTYLDTLNPAAVRAFIRITHEAYARRFGREFGKVIPGIFTDEPNHGHKLHGESDTDQPGTLPWTDRLPTVFRRRYGYDLLPHLMELVYDVDSDSLPLARYHYHDCVTYLYVNAFCRQIGEWCAKHKLLFTGHQLEEDSLSSQTDLVGSCLRTYEYMQAPGMDLLTERWRLFNTAKQVSSAARQFGRLWRLTETYGCTGWDFSFAGHKALGDWQTALGINLRCQHLVWYSMEGQAKRDYPASIFYQSPWWKHYSDVEDYFARVLAVMTRGKEVRDLLVIHPVESMWTLVKKNWRRNFETRALDEAFARLTNQLLAEHLDFDFGDEELLARHARVTRMGGSASLKVARASYKAVLVPTLRTVRRTTLDLLQRFKAAGGTVVFLGEPPRYVDARPVPDASEFASQCTVIPEIGSKLVEALSPICRRVSIEDDAGRQIGPALYLLREDNEGFYLFVCNTGEDFLNAPGGIMEQPMVRDRTLAFDRVVVRVSADTKHEPIELDPCTGDAYRVSAQRDGQAWRIHTSLPALGSRLFVLPKKYLGISLSPARATLEDVQTQTLSEEPCPIALSELNNLVLDRPSYRIGTESWQAPQEILRVDRAVRTKLGLKPRGGAMIQPWARPAVARHRSIPVALKYEFECRWLPCGELYLALERPETFRIMLNGVCVSTDFECGWWVDRSLRRIPLNHALLRLGRNELILECDYRDDHPGLETVFILGNFGTEVQATNVAIVEPPRQLRLGDWVPQGLAFYSGSVTYQYQIAPELKPEERIFVRVPEPRGVAVCVWVNGVRAGLAAWPPYEVEITNHLGQERPVRLDIQVLGHRRNSHGPLHYHEKWPAWTGPHEFVSEGDKWVESYQLVPCGLMKAPELVIRRSRP